MEALQEELIRTVGFLRTRPIFHWTPHRICSHISLCVLALLLERMAEQRAGDTWRPAKYAFSASSVPLAPIATWNWWIGGLVDWPSWKMKP